MPPNDDRPDAGGEGAGDQGREFEWLPGFDPTASAAGVNLSWLPPAYRQAVARLKATFETDFPAFTAAALDLIDRNGWTSADEVNAELKSRTRLKRDHYWRAILARVFRHRHPARAGAMRIRRGQLDRRPERFWSDLFPR